MIKIGQEVSRSPKTGQEISRSSPKDTHKSTLDMIKKNQGIKLQGTTMMMHNPRISHLGFRTIKWCLLQLPSKLNSEINLQALTL